MFINLKFCRSCLRQRPMNPPIERDIRVDGEGQEAAVAALVAALAFLGGDFNAGVYYNRPGGQERSRRAVTPGRRLIRATFHIPF